MDKLDKLKEIQKLTEDELRQNIILPLLGRMGYKAATLYHGPRESGKDVICFDYDKLRSRKYLGIVAKTFDLTGSVSSKHGLREVLYQVEQCFSVPYENLFGMQSVTMDEVWIVTTGKIISGAETSIIDALKKSNLSKLVKFISGEYLIELIDEYFISYWDVSKESIEFVRGQRDRALSYLRKLLLQMGGAQDRIDEIITQIKNSEYLPRIDKRGDLSLSYLGTYATEFEKISGVYQHNIYSNQAGLIKEIYLEAKNDLYYSHFDISEIIENYEKVLKTDNPEDFVNEFESKLEGEYPFHGHEYGRVGDASRKVGYLQDGLAELREFIKLLEEKNKLNDAIQLFDSIDDSIDDVREYLVQSEKEEVSFYWAIENNNIKFLFENVPSTSTKNIIKTKHDLFFLNRENKKKKKTVDSVIKDVIDSVLSKIRSQIDKEIGFEY